MGRGTSSKRDDGGRSLVPMTPVGTPRDSEEASMTPAVYIGSAAITTLAVRSPTPTAILAQSEKLSMLFYGQPARGRRIGSDCGSTGSTRPSNRGRVPDSTVTRQEGVHGPEGDLGRSALN